MFNMSVLDSARVKPDDDFNAEVNCHNIDQS